MFYIREKNKYEKQNQLILNNIVNQLESKLLKQTLSTKILKCNLDDTEIRMSYKK